jgi:drug/metabolite transporter (DMT)-like permease
MDGGVIGGWIGAAVGVVGGVIGTVYAIRNSAGPRERAFMVKAAFAGWLVIAAYIMAMRQLPATDRWWLSAILYALVLPLAITKLNRHQARLRREEGASCER